MLHELWEASKQDKKEAQTAFMDDYAWHAEETLQR